MGVVLIAMHILRPIVNTQLPVFVLRFVYGKWLPMFSEESSISLKVLTVSVSETLGHDLYNKNSQ